MKTMDMNIKQALSALGMTILGLILAISTDSFVPHQTVFRDSSDRSVSDSISNQILDSDLIGKDLEHVDVVEVEPEPEPYRPSVDKLNLAHYFPQQVDQSNILNSYAGKVFKELTIKDSEWLAGIYDLADMEPSQMAARLGRSKSSVTGLYNSEDEKHNPDDASTWVIDSFKNAKIAFYNADGTLISGYSNVKEILSMANVYTYYKDMEDGDAFRAYANQLWINSHSYSINMGEVYYCKGCLDDEAPTDEVEAPTDEAESKANPSKETLPIETPEQTSETEPTTSSNIAHTVVSSTDTGPGIAKNEPAEEHTLHMDPDDTNTEPNQVSEPTVSPEEASTPATISGQATPSNAPIVKLLNTVKKEMTKIVCPGHIDINVKIVISGIDEKNGLFKKDTIGTKKDAIQEGGWSGWNETNCTHALNLSKQDWFEEYKLSISSISVRNPLSVAEIDSYMNMLPNTTSQQRKDVIKFALSSVGTVPYYWGGKPNAANYSGNSFGSLIQADSKGRILKGLDCSGWINWVYWSALNMRLPFEGTDGLSTCGVRIKRSQLQPGDIIVKTGSNSHVVMFLCWASDGKMIAIHETSASINNVTVGKVTANFPYYRSLLD